MVVSDGSRSYKAAIEVHLGGALHMLDWFHVEGWFAAGLTAVRRDPQRRQPDGVKPAFDPVVSRARFVLLRRHDHLDDSDQARLNQLLAKHPRLDLAWQALQELHGLYLADDRTGALAVFDRLADFCATGELPEFHSIVDTIIAWADEILDWHHTGGPSTGRIEASTTSSKS